MSGADGMSRILIAYSTVDGHTLKISNRIRDRLATQGHEVTLFEIRDGAGIDDAAFDCIIIGASIRYGKHRQNVYDFIERNRDALERRPSAFFTVNVVARKPDKNSPDTSPYIKTFREKSAWKPAEIGVFAGKIDYARYKLVDKLMIRFIMWMTKGPTDPKTCIEFTDWDAVDAFADRISRVSTKP